MSNLREKVKEFIEGELNEKIPDVVGHLSKLFKGDMAQAKELLFDTLAKLYLDDDKRKREGKEPLFVRESVVALIKTSARNLFNDRHRKSRPKARHYENIDLERLFFDESFENEGIERRQITLENMRYVLEHLEDYGIIDEIKKRVLIDFFYGKRYKQIVRELYEDSIIKNVNDVTVMNDRTKKKLRKAIEQKHPNFTTDLISKNRDNG